MSFINFSNHRIESWSEDQLSAARQWGEIVDVPFPYVDVDSSEDDIRDIACKSVDDIMKYDPDVVMCQGEFTLSYAVISMLLDKGVKVVSACSDRRVEEKVLESGGVEKTSFFQFVKFRDYMSVH